MKRSAALVLAAALSLPLLLATPAAAQEPQHGLLRNVIAVFRPPTPDEERAIATSVGLTDDQKTKMKSVNERYRSDSQDLLAKYRAAYEDIVKLMQSTNPNKAQVNQRLKTFHQIHSQIVDREVGYWTDFKSILTPEQNQKFWNVFEQKRVRASGPGAQPGEGE
jgi:Spy/CpxP family protein refolding chaperone